MRPCRRLLSALARAAGSESPVADDSVAPTLPVASNTSDTELPPGARFGRHVVLDLLGAGGMGVVYSAYDPDLNRKVALEVLRNDGNDQLPIRDLLLAEAQAMAQLAHPNVVTVFDVGSVDDRVFLAMELIEGQTLAGWLRALLRPRAVRQARTGRGDRTVVGGADLPGRAACASGVAGARREDAGDRATAGRVACEQ